MRKFFVGFCLLASLSTLAQTTTTAITDGKWDVAGTWDNGIPANNYNAIIPAGRVVSINGTVYNQNTPSARPIVRLTINGSLSFASPGNDKLFLNNGSTIQISGTGNITSGGSSSTEILAIWNGTSDNIVYDNTPPTVTGPKYATATTSEFVTGTLPVTIKSFTGVFSNSSVQLSWSVADEKELGSYIVEQSSDSRNWKTVTSVRPQAGVANYKAIDVAPASGANFYRLKAVDLDGKFSYSPVIKVSAGKGLHILIGPNPAHDVVRVTLSAATAQAYTLQLVDSKGQVVRQKSYSGAEYNSFELNLLGVPKGVYQLLIADQQALLETAPLIIR